MGWKLLAQCIVKLTQNFKCKIRIFVFSNWKAKLKVFRTPYSKAAAWKRTGPTFVHCALDCCPTTGNTTWLWLFHLTSSSNRTFCLCSSCSGAARYSYCRCTDCSPLSTVVLPEYVPLSGCYVTLKPVMPPMTWKLEEFIDQNQNHEAPYESLASSGVQLALQNHQPRGFLCFVTCTVQLWQCLEIHAAGNWFFLCQNIFIHTSPSIKIISKKSKYTSDLESKQCPIQFPLFCCSTEQKFYYTKNSAILLLAKFQPNYL